MTATPKHAVPPGTTIHVVDPAPLLGVLEQVLVELRGLREDINALATRRPREAVAAGAAPPPDDPRWLTQQQVARMVQLTGRTIRKWSSTGRFPRGIPIAGHARAKRRWVRAEVEAWIATTAKETRE